MCIVEQEFNPVRRRPWRTWPATLVRLWRIIRASFSQDRMTYIPEESKVLYRSKDGKKENMFDALEWLAAMCSHVPNKGEQMVRYYGYYSNVSRGKRKKQNLDELIPSVLESDESSKERRKNWARFTRLRRVCPPWAWFTRRATPRLIFQIGRRVQGRRIPFFRATFILSAKIWPQFFLPYL
jgi:hypothetical protein